MCLSHSLHLNDLGSLARLMDIVLVLNTPLMFLSLSSVSELGDADAVSDVVAVSVSFVDFPISKHEFPSTFSFGKFMVSMSLGFAVSKLTRFFWVASGSVVTFSVLPVLFNRIPCCMAILCALGYFLLSSDGGGGSLGS